MPKFCVMCGKPIDQCVCKKGSAQKPPQSGGGQKPSQKAARSNDTPYDESFYASPEQYESSEDSEEYSGVQMDLRHDLRQMVRNSFDVSNENGNSGTGFTSPFPQKMSQTASFSSNPVFEATKKIVPECVAASDNETPIRQYTVAELRSRIIGITYKKALGRLQITNKRIIFRAAGKCIAGPTTIQSDVALDEVAGIEARREYAFRISDLLIALFLSLLAAFPMQAIASSIYMDSEGGGIALAVCAIIGCIIGIIMIKNHILLKCVLSGATAGLILGTAIGRVFSSFSIEHYGLFIFFIIFDILRWSFAVLYSVRPNLVLLIKSKKE